MTKPLPHVVSHASLSSPALTVVGLSIRTHNDEAARSIPALWTRITETLLAQRPADALREPGALVAVYGDYESDHTGAYTLTIGFPVPSVHAPAKGLVRLDVPPADYARYGVTEAGPAGIFGAWERVWTDHAVQRAFTYDLEVYPSDFASGGLPFLLIATR